MVVLQSEWKTWQFLDLANCMLKTYEKWIGVLKIEMLLNVCFMFDWNNKCKLEDKTDHSMDISHCTCSQVRGETFIILFFTLEAPDYFELNFLLKGCQNGYLTVERNRKMDPPMICPFLIDWALDCWIYFFFNDPGVRVGTNMISDFFLQFVWWDLRCPAAK